jgi:hypothetical protein
MQVDRVLGSEPTGGGPGEIVCLAVRPHWYAVVRQALPGLVLLVAGVTLALFGEHAQEPLTRWVRNLWLRPQDALNPAAPSLTSPLSTFLEWAATILTVLGSAVIGWALLHRHFTRYSITISAGFAGRIIQSQGILSRRTVAVPLAMVNDLVLYEPLLGRILGWGHVDIQTGNDFQGDRLEYVPNPRAFYAAWTALLDNGYGGYAGSPGGSLP